MWRSIGAVIGGFAAMAVAVMITTVIATVALLGRPRPGVIPRPTPTYLAVNLLCGLASGILGGYVCARIASANPFGHVVGLAVFMLAMSVVSAKGGQSGAPSVGSWYPYAIGAIGVIGVLLGGGIRIWSTA